MFLKDANNFTVNKASTLTTARTINGTSFSGSANITTANWGTARTLTVGNASKSVNGSANISWSLSEIGALPLTGGTMTGNLSLSSTAPIVTLKNTSGSDASLVFDRNSNANWRVRNTAGDLLFESDYTTEKGSYYTGLKLSYNSGDVTAKGEIYAKNGQKVYHTGNPQTSITGNAGTATTLQTTRTINGTNFNGSANITTANWGTARTITIGATGKSVNGSGNYSWSASEILAGQTVGYGNFGGLFIERTGSTNGASIGFKNSNGTLGYIGMNAVNGGLMRWSADTNSQYTVLDTGNYKTHITPANIGAAISSHTHYYAGSSSVGGAANSAVKATQDSAGQQINATYIKGLSVSGKTITYTKGDGTTGTITTQDTNTTYSAATTSANGLMTSAMVTKLNGIAEGANKYSHPTSEGNKHIPSGGASGNWLKWSSAGTAAWGALPSASTSAAGIVQLNSATNSTSTSQAATASAVKAAYDKANHSHNYLSTSGGTVAGNITLNVSGVDSQLIIYNNQGKKFILTTPYRSSATSDVTVTLPTGSGTIAVGSFIPLSGTTAVSGSISPNADSKYALGSSNKRFSVVYASSGCLTSSDSKLKENIKMVSKNKDFKPYTTDVDIEESVCSEDLYNYVKNTAVYTYNLKNTERNTLGVLADEIPENIFMKIGEYSKTEEEYQNELIRREELLKINETLDVTGLQDDSMILDTGLNYSEFKGFIENEVEEPVRLLDMSARIAMLQEVLGITLNKIEALEEEVRTLKEN